MPDDLKKYIDSLPAPEVEPSPENYSFSQMIIIVLFVIYFFQRKQVFVSCAGQFPKDKDVIGRIIVEPRGFPYYFYPYENTIGYLSPLVSVQFIEPKIGQLINVECIAWAHNVRYHGGERDRQGSVHFEILVDKKL